MLVDEENVLTYKQKNELRDLLGISTLEELYETFYRSKGSMGVFKTLTDNQLEVIANYCEKYLTEDEIENLKTSSKKYSTGALDPKLLD